MSSVVIKFWIVIIFQQTLYVWSSKKIYLINTWFLSNNLNEILNNYSK